VTGDETLRGIAESAMHAAYAPYSGFRVGAALRARDGRIFAGCNVENASYGVTLCAERVALGTAIAAGAREFDRLVISSAGADAASPCGACRQALSEFAPALRIVSCTGDIVKEWGLDELLPHAFRLDELNGTTA